MQENKVKEEKVPLKVTTISTNTSKSKKIPLIYLPRQACETLGFKVGTPVIILADLKEDALVIKKIMQIKSETQNERR
jgi:hypothetical protein